MCLPTPPSWPEAPTFFIKIVLDILSPLYFYVNFTVSFISFSSVMFLDQGMFISLCSILNKFF